MAQVSGSGAAIWFKPEAAEGVLKTTAVGGGGNTTVATAANPGDANLIVAADTGLVAGDVILVGNNQNMELLKIGAGYVSGTTIILDVLTPINFRHEVGEAVVESTCAGWTVLGNLRSFSPSGERGVTEDPALSGERLITATRLGNYDAGATAVASVGIENMGLYFLHAMNNEYNTTGTTFAGAITTLNGATAVGATSIVVAAFTDITAGNFLQIDTGANVEVFKVDAAYGGASTTIPVDLTEHPYGLRFAHANGVAVVEKIAPFTHTIITGTGLPAGCSFFLWYEANQAGMIIRGNKISEMALNVTPDGNIATLNLTFAAKAAQIIGVNLFGTPTSPAHVPYAHWECAISVDGAALTTNLLESVTITKSNNVAARLAVGSPFAGSVAIGEAKTTIAASYQFSDLTFPKKISVGALTPFVLLWTYIEDANHSLKFNMPKVRLGGTALPGVNDKGPVTGNLTGVAQKDSGIGSDLEIQYKTLEVSLPLAA